MCWKHLQLLHDQVVYLGINHLTKAFIGTVFNLIFIKLMKIYSAKLCAIVREQKKVYDFLLSTHVFDIFCTEICKKLPSLKSELSGKSQHIYTIIYSLL